MLVLVWIWEIVLLKDLQFVSFHTFMTNDTFLPSYIIVLSIELLGTVFSVTLIYFKNNLCQAIFILFKCFKHVYYFFISKDFLVISVYYKCFAGLFYRNDVLISIVSVPKTIHIVMGFFYHCE